MVEMGPTHFCTLLTPPTAASGPILSGIGQLDASRSAWALGLSPWANPARHSAKLSVWSFHFQCESQVRSR